MPNPFPFFGRHGPVYRELLVLHAFHERPDTEFSGSDMYDAIYADGDSATPDQKSNMVGRLIYRMMRKGYIRRLPIRRRLHHKTHVRRSMVYVYLPTLEGMDHYRKYRCLIRTRR